MKGTSSSCNKYNDMCGENKQPLSCGVGRSVAGLQAFDQVSHRRHIAVCVERVRSEAISVVPSEHQLEFDIVRVADRLKCLLNAEAARVCLLPCGTRFVLGPI